MRPSLFPEMERERLNDQKAAKREEVQRARERLRHRDFTWLIDYLLEHGPQTEHGAMMAAMDEQFHFKDAVKGGAETLAALYDLWLVRKLWRQFVGVHPGSGEDSYLYGIRGVQPIPAHK